LLRCYSADPHEQEFIVAKRPLDDRNARNRAASLVIIEIAYWPRLPRDRFEAGYEGI
jgi:hypothetical protein